MKNSLLLALLAYLLLLSCNETTAPQLDDELFLIYTFDYGQICIDDVKGRFHREIPIQGFPSVFTSDLIGGFARGGGYFWTLGVDLQSSGGEGYYKYIQQIYRIDPQGQVSEYAIPWQLTDRIEGAGIDYAQERLWIASDEYYYIDVYTVDPDDLTCIKKYSINKDYSLDLQSIGIDEDQNTLWIKMATMGGSNDGFYIYDLTSGDFLDYLGFTQDCEIAVGKDYIWAASYYVIRINKTDGFALNISPIIGNTGLGGIAL